MSRPINLLKQKPKTKISLKKFKSIIYRNSNFKPGCDVKDETFVKILVLYKQFLMNLAKEGIGIRVEGLKEMIMVKYPLNGFHDYKDIGYDIDVAIPKEYTKLKKCLEKEYGLTKEISKDED